MDFKSLLQSMDNLSEDSRIHKGTYGNKYGSEDVRDQYGHRVGKVDKGAEAKKSEPKKGRGRPKKDTGDAGVKFDTSHLSGAMGSKKPSKPVGTVSKKHSLKEYIEEVESTKQEQLDEAMFPGSAIGDKLRGMKQGIGQYADSLKLGMAAAPAAGAGAAAGAAISPAVGGSAALFAPALGAGALGGAAAALGGFLTYKGLNWLAQKLFGTKEEALEFAKAHLKAAGAGQPNFAFQGKEYPVKIKSPQEAQALYDKVRNLQSQVDEDGITLKPMPGASQIVGDDGKVIGTADANTANQIKQAAQTGKLNFAGDKDLDESDKLDELSPATLTSYAGKRAGQATWAGGVAKALGGRPQEKQYYRDTAWTDPEANYGPEGEKYAKFNQQALGNVRKAISKGATPNNQGYDWQKQGGYGDASNPVTRKKGVAEVAPPGEKAERMVKHIKKSYAKDGKLTPREKAIAYATTWKAHKAGKVEESVSLTGKHDTLEHIITKFKHEVKNFLSGQEMDQDLFEALFDYYASAGEMPYGIAKARTGDPFDWVADKFEQDVPNHLDEESKQLYGNKVTTKPSTLSIAKPNPNPAPFNAEPTGGSFLKNLTMPAKTFEGKNMKDIQFEAWDKELNTLLNEGFSVSSSTGQPNSPDSVTITATDGDAQELLSLVRKAGIGMFAGEPEHSGYGAPVDQDAEGHGTEPEQAPAVVGDGDDMMSLLKKMAGIEGGEEGDEQPGTLEPAGEEEGQDYEDEEGHDSEEQNHDEEGSEESDEEGEEEEQTDEGNAFTGKLAQTPQGGEFKLGDKEYKDTSSIEEDDMEEGNMFTGNLAKARAAGKTEADLDGDGDMEKIQKEGEEETCNECGMYESECGCDHENVEEGYANEPDIEMTKLKALLSMGNDLNKPKHSQTVGNPTRVQFESQLNDWKKLSGI